MKTEDFLDSLMLDDDRLGQLMFIVSDSASKPDGEFLYSVPASQIQDQRSLPFSLHLMSNAHKQLAKAWTIAFQSHGLAKTFLLDKIRGMSIETERKIAVTNLIPFSSDIGDTIKAIKNHGAEMISKYEKNMHFLEKAKDNLLTREEVLTLLRECPGVEQFLNCTITVSPSQKIIINDFLKSYANLYLEKSLQQQAGLLLPKKYYQPLLDMLMGSVDDRGLNNIKVDSRQSQPFCHNILSLVALHKIKLRSLVLSTYPVAYVDDGHMTAEDRRKVAKMKPGSCWVAVLDIVKQAQENTEKRKELPKDCQWEGDLFWIGDSAMVFGKKSKIKRYFLKLLDQIGVPLYSNTIFSEFEYENERGITTGVARDLKRRILGGNRMQLLSTLKDDRIRDKRPGFTLYLE